MVLWCSCMRCSKCPIHFTSFLSFSFLCWLGEGLGENEIILFVGVIQSSFVTELRWCSDLYKDLYIGHWVVTVFLSILFK